MGDKVKVQTSHEALIDEFREYLRIDRPNIDLEMVQQASLFHKVSEAAIKATAKRDRLKLELKELDAELYAEKKQDLLQGGEKATEAAISNEVLLDKDRKRLAREFIDAEEAVGQLDALKDSFQQRGYMIRDLGSLYTAKYFESDAFVLREENKELAYRGTVKRTAAVRERKRLERKD